MVCSHGICKTDTTTHIPLQQMPMPSNHPCIYLSVFISGVVYRIDNAVRVGPLYGGAPGDIPNTCTDNAPNPIRQGPAFDEPARNANKAVKPAAAGEHTY